MLMNWGKVMNIVVDINHPAHVHFFKHFIWEMEKRGHNIKITVSEKDIAIKLLEAYNIPHENLGSYGGSLASKVINLPWLDMKMFKAVRSFNPDIFLGIQSIRAAHVAFLLRKPFLAFTDSEPVPEQLLLFKPFASKIITPHCFRKNLGNKHVRYTGYHELAYLHPKYFKPDPTILEKLNNSARKKICVMRFVSWNATHDFGRKGILERLRFVKELSEYAQVIISAESSVEKELEEFLMPLPPQDMHNLLYYADLFVGDSQTMTTEAAVLGTPAIRTNSFVGDNDMGNFIELQSKYGLIFNYNKEDEALKEALNLLAKPNLKEEWLSKRKKMLSNMIDVNEYMIKLVESYWKVN